jgi:hypothetical protein
VLYGTTREFLEHVGLRDLEDLPPFESPAGAGATGGEPAAGAEGALETELGSDSPSGGDAGERGRPSAD